MPAFRVLAAAAVVAATIPLARAGEVSLRQPPGELSEIKQLPNPFVFLDGSVVRSKEDWNRRRVELKSLFEKYEYGHLPPKPEKMTVTAGQVRVDEGARVARQELAVTLEHAGKTLVLHISLGLPLKPAGPVPVVVEGEFARPDPGRPGKPPALTLGGSPVEWLRVLTDRGYGVAEFNFQEAAFDNGARSAGVYHLYGNGIDCGALMAWAWGIHRVIDAIEGDARIDSKKIVVTGHKRYGKTALLAGAFDERIALTVPSHSGCAGTAPYRFIYGANEQIQDIVAFARHWFEPQFGQFVGKVDRLPIDQHLLQALVAPRALVATEGTDDMWTNPRGSQLTYLAAARVYEFLGARDRISVRYRPEYTASDQDLLEFADHVFFGRPLSDRFGKLPFPEDKNGFNWDIPK